MYKWKNPGKRTADELKRESAALLAMVEAWEADSMPFKYPYMVAAADSPQNLKDIASYVCTGSSDQTVLNQVIQDVKANSGTTFIYLAEGTYKINGPIEADGKVVFVGQELGYSNICPMDLQEGEEDSDVFPEEDWYMFDFLSNNGNLGFQNVWVYATSWVNWVVPEKLVGLFHLNKHHWGMQLSDGGWWGPAKADSYVIMQETTGNNFALWVSDSSISSDSATNGVFAKLLGASTSMHFYDSYLGNFATGVLPGGANNPRVGFHGYRYLENITDLIDGTVNVELEIDTVLKKTGQAVVPDTATEVVVTHGYPIIPTIDQIRIIPTNVKAVSWFLSDITATTFKINVPTDPGATTATFDWVIE